MVQSTLAVKTPNKEEEQIALNEEPLLHEEAHVHIVPRAAPVELTASMLE